jgi:hypothetical protein
MTAIACWACGRRIYATGHVDALAPDERRCPRCGALMSADRRTLDRRERMRRQNPPDDPGPPEGTDERRLDERRKEQRRRKA